VLKPIIELGIGHIGQKYEGWLSVSADEYLRLELLANSMSVLQQHCHCVHHKWMSSHAPLTLLFLDSFVAVTSQLLFPFSNESMSANIELQTLD